MAITSDPTIDSNHIERKSKMKGNVGVIKLIIESLRAKEEALEDEINDKFDQLAAVLEERRTCLLNQLHSRVNTTCEKLGIISVLFLSFI